MNLIHLKEKIAIADFTVEERDYLLDLVNEIADARIDSPPNTTGGTRMEAIYAFLSVDPGGEGIVATGIEVDDKTVGLYTLVTSNLTQVKRMRPFARAAAVKSGKPVRLVKFTQREDIETLRP